MKKVNKDLIEFLRNPKVKTWINEENFASVYNQTKISTTSESDLIPKLTEIFLQVGINPLIYLTQIPEHYLQESDITHFNVPSNIINIGRMAFYGCHSLANLSISMGVKEIADNAFAYCDSLENLILPDSVVYLGWDAFQFCTQLKQVRLSNNLQAINDSTFSQCKSLTTIIIPDRVTRLEHSAFSGCSNLKNLILGANISKIDMYILSYTNITEIIYNNTMEAWKKININPHNDELLRCTIICTDGKLHYDELHGEWVKI